MANSEFGLGFSGEAPLIIGLTFSGEAPFYVGVNQELLEIYFSYPQFEDSCLPKFLPHV